MHCVTQTKGTEIKVTASHVLKWAESCRNSRVCEANKGCYMKHSCQGFTCSRAFVFKALKKEESISLVEL